MVEAVTGQDGTGGPLLRGNALAGLGGLLGGLGLVGTQTRDDVESVVAAALSARGHEARVAFLRYGRLRLEACPQSATLLRFDVDALLAELAERVPGAVSTIDVRVVR